MPVLHNTTYKAPFWLPGGHAQTIFPSLFRKVPAIQGESRVFATSDGDSFRVDILRARARRSGGAVVLSHGLEGNSRRSYMLGMSRVLLRRGWDCICRNFRGCGGEINPGPGMYHSGQTEDLHTLVEYCVDQGYERIMLVGFSMGGNQVLKYLGEAPLRVPVQVRAAAVISVPCDLPGAAAQLDRPGNRVYMHYFLSSLRHKIRLKHARYPGLYPLAGLARIRTFAEFDARYTAPVHGFASALDYWQKAASLPHLESIRIPTLVMNARNDPFLSKGCFPVHQAERNPFLFLEAPAQGGHVGFTSRTGNGDYWPEQRTAEFLSQYISPGGMSASSVS